MTAFTVFRHKGFFCAEAESLAEFLRKAYDFYDSWGRSDEVIAWMSGRVEDGEFERNRDESIAAGRLIGRKGCAFVAEHGNPLEDKKEPETVTFEDLQHSVNAHLARFGVNATHDIVTRIFGTGLADAVKAMPSSVWARFIRAAGAAMDGEKEPGRAPSPLDKLENEREPKRAPLPGYGQSTPFDNFKGFKVKSNTSEHHSAPFLCASPDLQDESATRHLLVTVRG